MTTVFDPRGLVGRIAAALAAPDPRPLRVVGPAGVGKSRLVDAAAAAIAEHGTPVRRLRADMPETLRIDLAQAGADAGFAPPFGEDLVATLGRWPASGAGPWVLVCDAADGLAPEAAALAGAVLPGTLRMVVVAREDTLAPGAPERTLAVTGWSPDEGAAFLAARGVAGTQAERRALAKDLGGMPLALAVAAATLVAGHGRIGAYRDRLALVETAGLTLDGDHAATGDERSASAAISLAAEALSPAAQRLLRLLAFVGPHPLPQRWLTASHALLPADLSVAAADPAAWAGVAGELVALGLATIVPGEVPALAMPAMVQQVARALLAEASEDAAPLQALFVAAVPAEAGGAADDARWSALAAHVPRLERHAGAGWQDAATLAWLLDRLAAHLLAHPALQAAAPALLERSVRVLSDAFGDRRADVLAKWSAAAAAEQAAGRRAEAERLLARLLAIRPRVSGIDHPETVAAMEALAALRAARRDAVGTRALAWPALAARRRLLGDDHADVLAAMSRLAGALREAGDSPAAATLEQQVWDIRRRTLGEEHVATIAAMNDVAETRRAEGDLAGARALQRRQLEILERTHGAADGRTLAAMNNFALTLAADGDLAGARELQSQVVAALGSALGEDHADTLRAEGNLAMTLRSLGDLAGARQRFERILAVQRRSGAAVDPAGAETASRLAITLWESGERDAAVAMMGEAAAAHAAAFGPEHPDTRTVDDWLAQMRAAQSRTARPPAA